MISFARRNKLFLVDLPDSFSGEDFTAEIFKGISQIERVITKLKACEKGKYWKITQKTFMEGDREMISTDATQEKIQRCTVYDLVVISDEQIVYRIEDEKCTPPS